MVNSLLMMVIGNKRYQIGGWPLRSTPEPVGRVSWEVWRRRLLWSEHIGYVNARGHDDAMQRARLKWPEHQHMHVVPRDRENR